MKKIISLLLISSIAIGMTACGKGVRQISSNSLVKAASYPESISYDDYDAKSNQFTENQGDEAYTKALQEFASKSAAALLAGKDENTVYSPVSLYFALSVLASGADTSTKEEIYTLMGLAGKDADYLTEQTGKLYRRLYTDNKVGTLKIANALWLEKDFKFNDAYVTNAADNLYASIYNVNFKDKETLELMGKWVSDNTNGLIKPEIQLSDELAMIIMNTIYFKDRFRDEFNKELTKEDTFYLEDGSTKKVDFMNKVEARHSYIKNEDYIGTKLSFLNNGAITFILPEEGVSVDEIIGNQEKVTAMFQENHESLAEITFKVPKFDYGSNLDLVEMLNTLGMKSAFEETADFSLISEGDLFVSGVKQEAHIILDEEGVEAAAYTEISMDTTSAIIDELEKIEFTLDRPFIYGITANDGTLLFVGVVKDPGAVK